MSDNRDVPGVVVGTGSAIPAALSAARFRQKFGISAPFVVYVGRIDENKGCKELFAFFEQYARTSRQPTVLVLMGHSLVPIPESPYVKHLGFVSDEDKFDGIAASDALIMPSFFESLSMVALEAWALGKPVLANGRCDVLRGQVVRSNAGLYYESFQEFAETLRVLTVNRDLAAAMGRNGRAFHREHYDWPVVEGKYERMLASLHSAGTSPSALEPEPGWLAARRRTLPPARQVVEALPSGPVLAERPAPKPATTRRRGLYRGHR